MFSMIKLKAIFAGFFLFLSLTAAAQKSELLLVGQGAPLALSSMSYTSFEGGVAFPYNLIGLGGGSTPQFFSNGAGVGGVSPFIADANVANPTLSFYTNNSSSSAVAVGIVSDSSSAPGNVICQSSLASISGAGWHSVTLSSCNLVAGTRYWAATLSQDGSLNFAYDVGSGSSILVPCSNTPALVSDESGPFGSFPGNGSAWTPNLADSGCYATYAAFPATTTASFALLQTDFVPQYLNNGPGDQTAQIAQTGGTDQGYAFAYLLYSEGQTVVSPSVSDSASESYTKRLGDCTTTITGTLGMCLYSFEGLTSGGIDQVGLTTATESWHGLIMGQQFQKNGANPTYDSAASCIDGTALASPFTGCSVTVSHAPELLICFVGSNNMVDAGAGGTWTAGSGWSPANSGQEFGSSGATFLAGAEFTQIALTNGTYNCKGSNSLGGTHYITMTYGAY